MCFFQVFYFFLEEGVFFYVIIFGDEVLLNWIKFMIDIMEGEGLLMMFIKNVLDMIEVLVCGCQGCVFKFF